MVGGFLGVVIALERAVVLGRGWLGAAALLWLLGPERVGGVRYDAMLQATSLSRRSSADGEGF